MSKEPIQPSNHSSATNAKQQPSQSKDSHNHSGADPSSRNERRKLAGGIAEGGRRKSDRAIVPPISQSSRIWFGLSLILTLLIMIWTFSVPFRTEKPIFAWDKSDMPVRHVKISPEILADPEHSMSDDDYRIYIQDIEDNLQEEFAKRNRTPVNLPGAKQATVKAEQMIAHMGEELDLLAELEKKQKNGFLKGSLQFEAMEGLKKRLAESDELLPAK